MKENLYELRDKLEEMKKSKLGTKDGSDIRKCIQILSRNAVEKYNKLVGQVEILDSQYAANNGVLDGLTVNLKIERQCHELLTAVSDYLLANDPARHIESVITDILRKLVNENIVSFNIKTFEIRNQLETHFTITRRYGDADVEQPIMDCTGGGAVDVAFFLLRIVLLMNHPSKPRKILFADEPVKCLSPDKREYFMDLLKKITTEFGIQLILVTQEMEYAEKADNVIRFSLKGDKTHAEKYLQKTL